MGPIKVAFCLPDLERDSWLRAMVPASLLGQTDAVAVCVFAKADRFVLSRFDVVWFDNPWTAQDAETVARLRGRTKRICFLNEHLAAIPSYAPHYEYFCDPRCLDRAISVLNEADCVVTPTGLLMERYRRHNPNTRVITPGPWPSTEPPPPEPGGAERVRIAWIGHPAVAHDLAVLDRLIPRIAKEFPQVEWCSTTAFSCGTASTAIRYDLFGKPESILRGQLFDIGIYPLLDNDYNRCRYPTEIAEFASHGIPVVASDIGQQAGLLSEGSAVLLARDEEAWEKNLSALIADASLRRRMGDAARRAVRALGSVADCARAYRAVIDETLGRSTLR